MIDMADKILNIVTNNTVILSTTDSGIEIIARNLHLVVVFALAGMFLTLAYKSHRDSRIIEKSTKLRAIFVGEDKSQGFLNGKIYDLYIAFDDKYLWVIDEELTGKPTPYTNGQRFKENWVVLNDNADELIRKAQEAKVMREEQRIMSNEKDNNQRELDEQYIEGMASIWSAIESEGLGYAILHGYIEPNTGNEELDTCIIEAQDNLDIISRHVSAFEEEVAQGKHRDKL